MLRNPAWCTAAGRQIAEQGIDALFAEWTRGYDKLELAAQLQSRGIAAGPVQQVDDLLFDPHLAAREVFQLVEHRPPQLGARARPAPVHAVVRRWPAPRHVDRHPLFWRRQPRPCTAGWS